MWIISSHYVSESGLSWDAMFKMTKIELELIPDPDVYILWERYNSTKSHHPQQESKHIYLDVNNLYGYAISKVLPTSGFECIDPKEFELNKYTSNSSKVCALETDLEYPKELQELHND